MKKKSCFLVRACTFFCVFMFCAAALAKDPQLVPRRLSSTGDSMTEAVNAELPGANHWASWVNGYHWFWQWLFGMTDVYSHNQRITRNFGRRGRKNFMEAKSGADMFDFPGQTAQAVSHQAQYVTVLMGHNDVCKGDFADIPTDEEFEANFRAGLANLKNGLPAGATIYVIGIADIHRLWDIAKHKKALGIVDCEVLWAGSVLDWFPCATMLSPLNREADRQYARSRNIAFNNILERVAKEYEANDPHHYYVYTDAVFNYSYVESHVSDIDCFHPSAFGQKELSRETWDTGPFSAYQR